jgi:hypothetical protein
MYLTETFFHTNVNSLLVMYSSKYIQRTFNAYIIFIDYHVESSKLLHSTVSFIDLSSI